MKKNFLTIRASAQFDQREDQKKPPKFSMIAYTGAMMDAAGFQNPVVVEMEGITFDQAIPVYHDHDSYEGVGHTTAIRVENGNLVADGIISRDNDFARDVAVSGLNGYPWQASIAGPVLKKEELPKGASALVNGAEVTGPLTIIKELRLCEISFVDYGADGNTSAKVSAKKERSLNMPEDMKNVVDSEMNLEAEVTKSEDSIAASASAFASAPQERKTMEPAAIDLALSDFLSEQATALRAAQAAEMRRIAAIRKIAGEDYLDEAASAIEAGKSAETFELELLRKQCAADALRQSRPAPPTPRTDTPTSTNDVIECIGLSCAGKTVSELEKRYRPEVLEAAHKNLGCGLRRFFELACGRSLGTFQYTSPREWVQAAFSTASLPGVLGNIANKRLLDGFGAVDDSWRKIFDIGSVPDFKENTDYRVTMVGDLPKMAPGAEFTHGSLSEESYSIKAANYGERFSLTAEMIKNDDLNAFAQIPYQYGLKAARTIAKKCWELVLANPQSFFSSGHKNLLTGTTGALSVEGLSKARTKFAKQTYGDDPLNVMPKFLLVPPELAEVAEMLMKSTELLSTTTMPSKNPHAGLFEVVVCPYLSSSGLTGYSDTAYYLFADPRQVPAFKIAFIDGIDRPTIQNADLFDTLGISYRCFIAFGVKEQDYRGAVKVTGAT